jgi:hypothetical protein
MRTIIILLFSLSTVVYGQTIKFVHKSYGDYFLIENVDSFNINRKLPDGQYRNFYNNDTTKLHYLFNLSNNKVTGFFLSYHENGKRASIGTYHNDSLWTFRKDNFEHIDSSFKISYWRYQTKMAYPYEGRGMVEERTYKIPYESNGSIFIDSWYNQDNSILSIRKYQKERGLTQEIWLDSNGQTLSENTFEPNYTLSISKTPTQFVNNIVLKQQFKYEIRTGSEAVETYFNPTFEISDGSGKIIANVTIDHFGKVKSIYGNNINLYFDKDHTSIHYWNKRNKFRIKQLK